MQTLRSRLRARVGIISRFAQRVVFGTCLAGALCCTGGRDKSEAYVLLNAISALRAAPNEHKAQPLARLKETPCSAPSACNAKTACVDAFERHVHALVLGQQMRHVLRDAGPGPGPGPEQPDELSATLLEMNLALEDAKKLMPLCEQRVAALRIQHKL